MKNLKTSAFAAFAFAGALMGPASSAYAEDQTLPAALACRAVLGSVDVVDEVGLIAVGGSAVVRCDLLKKVAINNLNTVYLRVNKANPTFSLIFLSAYNSNLTAATSASTDFTTTTGNRSISLNIPDSVTSNGYLTLSVVLGEGDSVHGIRWIED